MPTKLGFKNPKHVMEMAVTDKYLGGSVRHPRYWDRGGGIGVSMAIAHRRFSASAGF
jgi:DMSO/TMAO reductase YedYZ molybdopterin-dependent catalytic subunit